MISFNLFQSQKDDNDINALNQISPKMGGGGCRPWDG